MWICCTWRNTSGYLLEKWLLHGRRLKASYCGLWCCCTCESTAELKASAPLSCRKVSIEACSRLSPAGLLSSFHLLWVVEQDFYSPGVIRPVNLFCLVYETPSKKQTSSDILQSLGSHVANIQATILFVSFFIWHFLAPWRCLLFSQFWFIWTVYYSK